MLTKYRLLAEDLLLPFSRRTVTIDVSIREALDWIYRAQERLAMTRDPPTRQRSSASDHYGCALSSLFATYG